MNLETLNYYKQIGCLKENRYYSMKHVKRRDLLLLTIKLIEKIAHPRNAKKHYQSFIIKKNTKSVKQSKVITQQPKAFENPNIFDIKSVILEHPKSSHKLRQ